MAWILGIETSCDETAVAIVGTDRTIAANIVHSQLEIHEKYGGVVPEVAARAHVDLLLPIVDQALKAANLTMSDMSAIAATAGPGLIGGVVVGCMMGKAFAAALDKPFIAVNHLEGHALTVRLVADVPFPYLLLLVSGGHTQILCVKGVGQYEQWGSSIDDALGEAFDKTAKMLGLPYPGGPQIEALAATGNPKAVPLPRPIIGQDHMKFSFSGLKTAVRQAIEKNIYAPADIAASFQAAVCDVIEDRLKRACTKFYQEHGPAGGLVVAGGVAANKAIRSRMESVAATHHLTFTAPPIYLCTDNAAMIAWVGAERYKLGLFDGLDFAPRPRWPLG